MKERGCQFLTIPTTYYDNLRKRLADSSLQVKEDLDTV
jgi:4-hydroxyphenylpyruvate dioxygenase